MKNPKFFLFPGRVTAVLCLLLSFLFSLHLRSQNVTVAGAVTGNGTYADLNTAFAAINGGPQSAATITVTILGNTAENASAVLNAGAWAALWVMPSGGSFTVSGNLAAPLVDLNGADRVFIDGLNNGGNALTFSNASTANVLSTTLRLQADAGSNSITNCTLLGSSTGAALGVITFSTGTSLGNSGNTISNCDIGPAGANLPVNGIYSSGSAGFDNTGNQVRNCMIHDFFSSSQVTNGILLAANSSAWTIDGNKFFQAATRTYGTANTHRCIQVTSGNNHAILDNVIGYASAASTGVYAMNSSVATRFVAIDLAVGTAVASSVQGNTITAMTLTTSSNASTANGILCGINITAGHVNVGNVKGNIIGGSSGANLLAGAPTAAQGAVVGINASTTGSVLISNNIIGGLSSSGIAAAISGGVSGINISGLLTGLTITGNTIGNTTANNMRGGTSGLTTGTSPVSGINMNVASLATPLITITSNTIQNMASYGTSTGGYVRGIWNTTGSTSTFLIADNLITNLVSDNANITVSNALIGTAGILLSSGNTSTISGNVISNIANTNTSATAIITGGITHATATNTTIRYNKIYNITNQSTSTAAPGAAGGIIVRSGTGYFLVHNNMISLGTGLAANVAVIGIWGMHGSAPNPNDQIYFNTVNIEGTVSSGAQPSFGFMRGDFTAVTRTAPIDLRNNIFTNTRSGGTGTHCAVGDNFGLVSTTTNLLLNSYNYNVLNANPASIGWWNGSQTFAGWKTASGQDANSFSGIPVAYVNPASDLHLNMGVTPTYIESGGQLITGFNTDIDMQARPGPIPSANGGALAPDIGADEIDGSVLYCSTPSGGTITPSLMNACSGQTLSASSASVSIGYGTAYQWQVSPIPGGPYVNLPTGFGATTTSYTSPVLTTGTVYIVLKTSCPNSGLTAISNEVTVAVKPTPTVSASPAATVICSGENLFFAGTPGTGTQHAWKGPDNYVVPVVSSSIYSASINATGTYSFTSTLNGCTSPPALVQVTVNATPTMLNISPASPTICAGSSQLLTATGGDVPGAALNFTPNTNQNTPTTYPAPYSIYWGGQKMQFLVLASELTAVGMVAGPLTSIQFPVASLGANWGTVTKSCQNFRVSLGLTNLTSLAAPFPTGLTVVCAPASYTPNVGFNVHTFSPTFNWDGVSNVIVETVFSNNTTGDQADAVISYNSPTIFQSTLIYRADGTSFANIAAATTTNEPANLVRPDFILKGQTKGTYTWSPGLNLSTTTGSVTTALPPSTAVYSVLVSSGSCSASASRTIEVMPPPSLSISVTPTLICTGQPATLTASGAGSFTWSTNSTATNIVVSPQTNTVYMVFNQTAPCPVVSATIGLLPNAVPLITVTPASATVCASSPASFTISGANTYSWSTGSTASTQTVYPSSNTVYTVTGTNATGCSSASLIPVTTKTLPVIVVTPPGPSVCAGSVTNLNASGASTYSWNSGEQTSAITVTVSASSVYTASGVGTNGCSSSQTVVLTALALPALVLDPNSLTICKGETHTLSVSGASTYTWKPGNTSTSTISINPNSTTAYSVSGTDLNNCSNTKTFSIVVDPCTGIVEGVVSNGVKLYPNPSQGIITIDFSCEGRKSVIVTNSLGAIVAELHSDAVTDQLDLGGMAKGVYFIQVYTLTARSGHRIVIH